MSRKAVDQNVGFALQVESPRILSVPQKHEITVPEGVVRIRLEEYLFERFRGLSRMYIRDVIRSGQCEVNGRIENKGKRVSSGDFLEIELDQDRESAMVPQEFPLTIVYEDNEIIVIDKPAGMLVHPTHREKSGTILNALNHHLNQENGEKFVRPGLVHRLDKETSGLLLVAKSTRAHRILARHFRLKSVEKRYVALVEGLIKDKKGTIEAPIGRFAKEKSWGVKPDGKPAETRFNVLERREDSTLVELEPITGRTNQLRIHCAAIGHPIVGDIKRGGRESERLCLHASSLLFRHPTSGNEVHLQSAQPKWS